MDPFALEARVKLAVPPARGLGSSATAIVAGLIGANAIMNSPLPKEKLLELAIDIEGHPEDDNVKQAFEELGFFSKEVKILGYYPSSELRKG